MATKVQHAEGYLRLRPLLRALREKAGLTMQESGISKLVAVRFEDWPDEDEPPAARAA